MNHARAESFGVVEVQSGQPIPYGAQFTLIEQMAGSDHPWRVFISHGGSPLEVIALKGKGVSGQSFVVIRQAERPEGGFVCLALPVEQLDEETEGLEDKIRALLARARR